MSTLAKMVEFRRDLAALDQHRKEPAKSKLRPRDRIRMRLRCRLCGRPRAVFRKFGLCRICFRNLASDGLIPGVTKASW
jgi:small subunit ribosomal protein S14